MAAGVLADRFGRARVLTWSILVYSLATGLTATATSVPLLALWRVLVGLGMGGEWSAGSVLVAETWPAAHRGKAIGLMQAGWALGYIAAALLAALVLPTLGWRWLFALGVLPALLAFWVRRRVPEPEGWSRLRAAGAPRPSLAMLARAPHLGRMLLAAGTATCMLFAYWGLFTWVPSYLAAPEAEGGAGLGRVKSTAWIVPMQLGALAGYVSFGFLADRFGRRVTFLVFVLAAAAVVPLYGLSARDEAALMLLGPLVGFFGHGYFSVFGAMLAELFPTALRGAAQGIAYNVGRGASAAAPWVIGALADTRGIGPAFALTSACYVLGALLVLRLPETRGRELA
jgi:MFS family permease